MARGGKEYQIAKIQGWKCKVCRGGLFNGEPLNLHHLKPIREGGGDEIENLEWVHEACHHNTYHGRRRSVGQSARAV
jgi:RNA-directed DNA polymerase